MIEVRRVYGEEKNSRDDFRILVDRIWPRGLKKEDVRADLWLKDIAPSSALRQWYAHDPDKWQEFRRRYFQELKGKRKEIEVIAGQARAGKVVLLYGAKDTRYNNAVALKEYLESKKIV